MRNTSEAYVYFADEDGQTVIVAPGDDVPAEVEDKAHNPKHLDGEPTDDEEPVGAGPSQTGGVEPAGDDAARVELSALSHEQLDDFADRHGVDLTGARSKDQKVDAIVAQLS